ncbi:MAG: SAM-dependent methyltransferase [Parcubacteria group bacterium Gr01-1014_49]|nr:MAG: SAM-dependent methyltransferase [Parcubacteria group bacterium Gr01-1014_49]
MTKHSGKTLDKKDGIRVIDCRLCGFAHVSPLPSNEELKQFYEQEFYQHERPNYFTETKEDLPWWMATYHNYYGLFERRTKGRTLLDIGSGPGHFLLCGSKRGWKTVGIEPSGPAARYSNKRGLATVNDFFSYDRAKKLGTFDVVHAAMVLEHVPDPIGFIEDMKRMLKKGGRVAIFCPNDYNPLQRILRDERGFAPWWVVPKHHLNYFTIESMKRLLAHLGFTIEDVVGTYPLETFLLAGKNYVGNHAVGRACHAKRKALELALYKKDPAILNDLYTGLAAAGIGREFMIIAKKN